VQKFADGAAASGRERLGSPFGGSGGYRAAPMSSRPQIGGLDLELLASRNGANGAALKSLLGDISIATSFRLQLGGGEEITRPMEENEWLYSCASVKASLAASVPLRVWMSDGDDADEAPESDPLVRLFREPNRITTWCELANAAVFSRVEHGEDWWFLANLAGQPIGEGDVPSQIIQVRGGGSVRISSLDPNGFPLSYAYRAAGSREIHFPAHAVLGFLDYDPYNRFRGLGAADVLRRTLQVCYQAQRYIEALVREGGDPGGIITLGENANIDQIRQTQEAVDAEFSNPANRGRYKVLGNAEFKANPIAPKDMEFEKLQKWGREAICSVTNVAAPVIGILDQATYSNYEQALRATWTNGVIPYLRAVEDVVNHRFMARLRDPVRSKWRIAFDVSQIDALREEVTDKITAAGNLARLGVGATLNESLALYGVDVDPLPEGDRHVDPFGGLDFGFDDDDMGPDDEADADDDEPEDTPPKAEDDDGEEEDRSASPLLRGFLPTREERQAYIDALEQRVIQPGQRGVAIAARKYLRSYELAQRKRIEAFAKEGENGKRFKAWIAAQARDVSAHEKWLIDVLLLDRAEWDRKMAQILEPAVRDVFRLALIDVIEELGGPSGLSITMQDPRVIDFLTRQSIQVVEGVNSTLAKQIKEVLVDAFSDVANIADLQGAVKEVLPDLDDHLRRVFGSRDARALTIARTETGHASNGARFMEMKAEGVTSVQWLTSRDEHVRESHQLLDGQVRALGEEFLPGLRYPLDENGDAAEVIQCRCELTAVGFSEEV